MTKKPIIAVDIDDVLAAEAAFIIQFSNERWGHSHTIEDYREDWGFWGIPVSDPEFENRADQLHEPGILEKYQVISDSQVVLEKLADKFTLIVVTSRRSRSKAETEKWLQTYFPGIFSKIVLTGFWDNLDDPERHLRTKGDILKDHRVDYVIDDQPKHCVSAAEHGIGALLFGDYAQSRRVDLPDGVTRCKDWQAVAEYFGV